MRCSERLIKMQERAIAAKTHGKEKELAIVKVQIALELDNAKRTKSNQLFEWYLLN